MSSNIEWTNVEQKAGEIEAHLHLLLGRYEKLAIGPAVTSYIAKTFPGHIVVQQNRIKSAVNIADSLLREVETIREDQPLSAALKRHIASSLYDIIAILGRTV